MSYYRNQNFTSVDPIFSLIREELKSYFQTGVVDDILFPTYVEKCLRRLGRSTYKVQSTFLPIEDFVAFLPSDFVAIREAWSCQPVYTNGLSGQTIKSPGADYHQVTTVVGNLPNGVCDTCSGLPNTVTVTYKTNDYQSYTYQKQFLLTPGNISKNPGCDLYCANYGSNVSDSFDVRGNRFFTNFRRGSVYIVYYMEELDENSNQMIPDDFRTKEYIEAYLKQKTFEQLSNTVTDETANQIMQKAQLYEQKANEAFVLADTEAKKEDAYDKQRAWKRTLNRNNRYKLPNGTRRHFR